MAILLGLLILLVSVAILSGVIIGVITYNGSDISDEAKKPVNDFLHSLKGKLIIALMLLLYILGTTVFVLLINT